MSSEQLRVTVQDELDALFAAYPASGQSRGLVYGIVGPEGLVHDAGFGVANDAGRVPDADTVFPIASMSKSFVAAAALVARDRGLLSLDDPITKYFPQFAGTGTIESTPEPPSLRELFSMSGGLTEDNSWVDPFIDQPVEQLLSRIGGLNYSHIPGTTFEYSNLGYTLAGLAVGVAAGQPIEQFTREVIFEPLGLASTFFDNETGRADGKDRAVGYSLDAGGEWVGFPVVASAAFAAAGGIQSTVRDLARWVTFLGSAYRPAHSEDDAVLSRSSRREMQRLHQLDLTTLGVQPEGGLSLGVTGYALGLMVTEHLVRGTIVAHAGGLPGFLLYMIWHPESGHGLVTLTNSHRGDPIELTRRAHLLLLDREDAPARTVRLWPETVRLRREVEALIRHWSDERAAEVFAENVDFDRPLAERRAEIEDMVAQIGPLLPPRAQHDVLSAVTGADMTWIVPGERGDLTVMIHLTPVSPAQLQELEIRCEPHGKPVSSRPSDISGRRARAGRPNISALGNVRVEFPD